jgi:hypothetical protein
MKKPLKTNKTHKINKKLNQKNKHLLIKTAAKFKFKRFHKGLINGFEFNSTATTLQYGWFGLKILKQKKLTAKNVAAFRETISRKKLLKKKQHTM